MGEFSIAIPALTLRKVFPLLCGHLPLHLVAPCSIIDASWLFSILFPTLARALFRRPM